MISLVMSCGLQYQYINLKNKNMKTIKYSFIALLICVSFISSSWKVQDYNRTITLQADINQVTPELLKQSSEILSGRLTSYGLDSFRVFVDEEMSRIVVTISDKDEVPDIEKLLTEKGDLAFYETYNVDEFAGLIKDDKLIMMLEKSYSGLGCADESAIKSVNDYISTYGHIEGCRLLWKPESDGKPACLYALKVDVNGRPLIVRSDIDSITFSRQSRIEVTFKPEAAGIFAEATARNINREIAIVIDDRVTSAPRVMGAVKGGKCEVSGDFTDKGSCLSLSLVTSDVLPLSLYITE